MTGKIAQTSSNGAFTLELMQSFVLAEVNRVAAGADSTDYLAARSRGPFSAVDRDELTVQHRLSGLRADFIWNDGEKPADTKRGRGGPSTSYRLAHS